MQHLEEGTIHAWLDGELGAAEAASIEAHVAECSACTALVAEARGLSAASSRILGALDEVPSGVVPEAKAPVWGDREVVAMPTPDTFDFTAHRAAREEKAAATRTRRWFNPRFAAAAAVAVMAVGTWTVLQRAPSPEMVNSSAAPAVSELTVEMMDTAALGKATATAQALPTAPSVAAPVDEAASRSAGPNAPRASAKVAAALEAKKEQSEADASKSRDNAGNAAGARALADAAPARVDTLREAPPATSPLARLAKAQADSARPVPAAAPAPARQRMGFADSAVANEARRLEGELKARSARPALENVVVTGAASTSRISRDVGAVLCYTVERSPLALQLNVPERVALHPDAGPVVGGQAWRAVRVPATGTGTETPWSWLMLGRGAVELARIEGTPPTVAQRVLLSTTGSDTTLRATLVSCFTR